MSRIRSQSEEILVDDDSDSSLELRNEHVLVTGGAGYIGSHTVLRLLQQGYKVSVIDNLTNSSQESLRRVAAVASSTVYFYHGDLRDFAFLDRVFSSQSFWGVIHFAALKSAPESVAKPLDYYDVNVGGTLSLLQAMVKHGVSRLVFSSTAAVYGTPRSGIDVIPETHETHPANPYGRTKLATEYMIRDVVEAYPNFGAVLLRYFNPVGAHESGIIGEDPKGKPGNLMPFVLQVAAATRGHLDVTGTDWPTHDGSGVRDFIHVVDLADGHIAALEHADKIARCEGSCDIFNMGTGKGTSVLDMIHEMERVTGRSIPWKASQRRPGDVARVVADPTSAQQILNWSARKSLKHMCQDAWRWVQTNPSGYHPADAVKTQKKVRDVRLGLTA
ncbi:UDP-glucose 4-epimerase [Spizellomyces punctatus DAOM BR117]|uniref:UDP-glucose 4-epimerase n=1 Tax=Spizellomyces punctatus (strain DAOM BR117) TaxID=645134 RepID=A0A0L0H547_SPIPD|nr:UDP-glucose 4-epimerase [Spizellomyces punctatus DAOM BR117]KNC95853.1 UDP-glucose 4-epimerase [Spizellomyces punctatus DAOM BR117]|eukprot:XP_016603893.1 UDP-glucose 4-epimerase [Spizellomyces punctatus DAOM BR117]